MIVKLKGIIDYIFADHMAINVNGVSYAVTINAAIASKFAPSQNVVLYIASITKEDGTVLYGFESFLERLWFYELIKLSGISGRIAINILGSIETSKLELALATRDEIVFSSISGIGKKLAARIVTEMDQAATRVASAMLQFIGSDNKVDRVINSVSVSSNMLLEALGALSNLGFDKTTAYPLLQEIISAQPEIALNELIRNALQKIKK